MYVYGWKFLNPYGATVYDGEETVYPLPGPSEKWGDELKHPSSLGDCNHRTIYKYRGVERDLVMFVSSSGVTINLKTFSKHLTNWQNCGIIKSQ